MFRVIVKYTVFLLVTFFYRHRIYGKEHLPKQGCIYAANHTSFLDPPILGISYPGKIYFLARASLFQKKWFAWVLKSLCAYPVKQGEGNIGTLRQAIELLKEGKNFALFPEGTRSEDGEIKEALPGIGLLVVRSHVQVVPVYIHGTFQIWGRFDQKPKIWTKQRTACVFGTPLDFASFEGDKKELQKFIQTRIMEAIKTLQRWYLDGARGSPP